MKQIISQSDNLPFLPKPFDGAALIARALAVLGARRRPPEEAVR